MNKKKLYKGSVITFERGTVNRSIESLAARWGWSRKTVSKFLRALESDGMVTTKRTTHGTTVTIENYGFYQCQWSTKGTTEGTTKSQQSSQPSSQPSPINNNDNNDNNEGTIHRASAQFVPPSLSEVSDYCLKRGNGIDANEFCDFYEARGWKLSKGLVMRDWKAAVRGWEKRQQKTDDRFDNHPKQREHYEDLDKELFGI